MRQYSSFPINNPLNTRFLQKASTVVFLNRRSQTESPVLAFGEIDHLRVDRPDNAFERFEQWRNKKKDHVFGHFSYELKNGLEQLRSTNMDQTKLPALFFFRPEYLLRLNSDHVEVGYYPERVSFKEVQALVGQLFSKDPHTGSIGTDRHAVFTKRMDRAAYIGHVKALKKHIAQGDIYEANMCFEIFQEGASIDPVQVFERLMELTEAPFSCYYKFKGDHILCASPERFMKCVDGRVWSEPMKGTIRRGNNPKEDEALKMQLQNDPKERSENVMIVDLVRNDLSKHAVKGSVQVEELFGVKTFKTVHQLVSTVSAQVKEGTSPINLIRDAFPMGSMTGAPKIRAMELIDEHENVQRGLYSGSIGHIEPNGNFDLNVVIRTIIYNERSKYLSLMVGSAITAASDPEKEYEECLLKAAALIKAIP